MNSLYGSFLKLGFDNNRLSGAETWHCQRDSNPWPKSLMSWTKESPLLHVWGQTWCNPTLRQHMRIRRNSCLRTVRACILWFCLQKVIAAILLLLLLIIITKYHHHASTEVLQYDLCLLTIRYSKNQAPFVQDPQMTKLIFGFSPQVPPSSFHGLGAGDAFGELARGGPTRDRAGKSLVCGWEGISQGQEVKMTEPVSSYTFRIFQAFRCIGVSIDFTRGRCKITNFRGKISENLVTLGMNIASEASYHIIKRYYKAFSSLLCCGFRLIQIAEDYK